jgi:protein-tyrosine phosphatase
MKCNIYWIHNDESSRLAIMPRPRGGDWLKDEIESLRHHEVDVLVSLLTPEEIADLYLEEELDLCAPAGLQFLSFPIPDRAVPESCQKYLQFSADLNRLHGEGRSIVIHCRAGIGRASLVAASVLVLQGCTVEDAFKTITAARGCPVPDTVEQAEWLVELFRNPPPQKNDP